MTRNLAIAALAATLAFGTASASAQSRQDQGSYSQKRHHAKKSSLLPAAVATKIACPKGGCRLIPATCKVTMEETWEGPTGNELIDCP